MSFFEDAVIGAKAVTVTMGEKASKFVDISKLRLSAAELSKEISRRYEALGRAIYDAKKADEDINGLVEECVSGIDTLYTRLDHVNMKIARIKEKKYCTSCGALIDEKALFCSRCGSRIEREQKAEEKPEEVIVEEIAVEEAEEKSE